jgi:hypothetical protein
MSHSNHTRLNGMNNLTVLRESVARHVLGGHSGDLILSWVGVWAESSTAGSFTLSTQTGMTGRLGSAEPVCAALHKLPPGSWAAQHTGGSEGTFQENWQKPPACSHLV